ncbi:MAG: hypothetical protein U5L09_13635 [Bacteroidales bacterium]|nr:hypothetical protein [Bacteroidales bacterium]
MDIQTKTVYNVPSVPIQSVIAKADTTESRAAKDELNEYAFVVKEGEVEQRKIISGVQDNEYIQIVEGLASGEQVVTAPSRTIPRKLPEGTEVEIVDKDDLFAEE